MFGFSIPPRLPPILRNWRNREDHASQLHYPREAHMFQ